MSMVTQCPGCSTTFRVTPPQLQAQRGMVRCGRCATVFDGFKTLATLPDELPFEAGPQSAASAGIEPAAAEVVTQPQIETGFAPAPAQEIASPEPQPEFGAEPFRCRTVAAAARRRLGLRHPAAFDSSLPRKLRTSIAAISPPTCPKRGHTLPGCANYLRCTVALPQRPRLISIEGSDMQETDPANPGLIALTATLRNQATIGLGYPSLDVILTDTREHHRRAPHIPACRIPRPRQGRARRHTAERRNHRSGSTSTASGLGAAGFRLALLPAPMR